VRLRSLADSPEAFGTQFDEAKAQPASEWHAAARASSAGNRRAWFIAEQRDGDGARPIGLIQARRRPPETCLLFSMWVDPGARRRGLGRDLLDAVESWARGWGGREIVLWVFRSNEGAIRLYENSGFERVTEGPDAEAGLKWDAIAMRRTVGDPGGPKRTS
jgi:ribosomal protein S18 acetylase RimI-like enzyme